MIDTNRQFLKNGTFRAWVPVIFFIVYWINSYFHYQFGLLIREPLHMGTHLYLITNLIIFIVMYWMGLGSKYASCVLRSNEDVWRLNNRFFRHIPMLCVIVFISWCALIADRFMTGSGSITKTLEETAWVREEMVLSPLTTVSMVFNIWQIIYLALYFLALASRYPVKRWVHVLTWGIFILMCFNAFLSANRGAFFIIVQYVAFYLLYIKGESIKNLMFNNSYLVARILVIIFCVVALIYFLFISRHRGDEDGLRAYSRNYKELDRYGLFKSNTDELDMAAFFLTYSYMSEGYQYIDLFLKHAPPFNFHPFDLLGERVMRQFRRVIPRLPEQLKTIQIGNEWRLSAGMSLHGWPTIWGWNLCTFGYIGGVMYIGLLAWWIGWCSRMFLQYKDVSYLMICLAWYLTLMQSFNNAWGDVHHHLAFLLGLILILGARRRFMHSHYHLRR